MHPRAPRSRSPSGGAGAANANGTTPFPEFPNNETLANNPEDQVVSHADDASQTYTYGSHEASQYPFESGENHVEYILVASFDIDRGSVMEHQYPGPISGDENMLAELMLPDQVHMRNQDWTIFFLHKDTSAEEEERAERRERRELRRQKKANGEHADPADATDPDTNDENDEDYDSESDEEQEDDPENPPLIYVLNLVNNKQDNTVKRQVQSFTGLG